MTPTDKQAVQAAEAIEAFKESSNWSEWVCEFQEIIIAALEAQMAGGWNYDIKSAPDGKRILICSVEPLLPPEIGYRNGDFWFTDDGSKFLLTPACWQPLPAAPEGVKS